MRVIYDVITQTHITLGFFPERNTPQSTRRKLCRYETGRPKNYLKLRVSLGLPVLKVNRVPLTPYTRVLSQGGRSSICVRQGGAVAGASPGT